MTKPERVFLDAAAPNYQLCRDVRRAIGLLPSVWNASTTIMGVHAEDVGSFNTAIGTTIEREVVRLLNTKLRTEWDPTHTFDDLAFQRQGSKFPDAPLLRAGSSLREMGIELKGWYVLSREGEPSFRYHTKPGVCTAADVLVVVPWMLDEVVRGKPIVFAPYIEQAQFASETTSWFWEIQRKSASENMGLKDRVEAVIKTNLVAVDDDGNNFARLARCGIPEMDAWLRTTFEHIWHDVPLRILQLAFEKTKDGPTVLRGDAWKKLIDVLPAAEQRRARLALAALRNAPEWNF